MEKGGVSTTVPPIGGQKKVGLSNDTMYRREKRASFNQHSVYRQEKEGILSKRAVRKQDRLGASEIPPLCLGKRRAWQGTRIRVGKRKVSTSLLCVAIKMQNSRVTHVLNDRSHDRTIVYRPHSISQTSRVIGIKKRECQTMRELL